MKKWRGTLFLFGLAILATACNKSNNNSPYPQISVSSLTPDSIKAGFFEDTAYLSFHYFDGDADLGIFPGNQSLIVLHDSRTTDDSFVYQFPNILEKYVDKEKGMEGDALVKIQAAFLRLRSDTTHAKGDTLTFSMYVIDNSGKQSNRVTTPQLILRP